MGNKNAIPPEAYQWKPGQSGNPKGKPKGAKHLSTWIQDMLTDESFSFKDKRGEVVYEGAPLKAIIAVAVYQSMHGNKDARDWLARHGYGLKMQINGDDPVEVALKELGLLDNDGQATGTSS